MSLLRWWCLLKSTISHLVWKALPSWPAICATTMSTPTYNRLIIVEIIINGFMCSIGTLYTPATTSRRWWCTLWLIRIWISITIKTWDIYQMTKIKNSIKVTKHWSLKSFMVYSDAYCNLKTKQTLLYGAVKQEEGNHLHGDMAILPQGDAPTHRFSPTKGVCLF